MPSISMKPLVPSSPGPPKDPKSFWAPCPAIREPCATRTIIGADSLTLEVSILTPYVDFSELASRPPSSRALLSTFYTRNHLGSTPILPSHPYSPECVEGKFCELPLYGVLRSSPCSTQRLESNNLVI